MREIGTSYYSLMNQTPKLNSKFTANPSEVASLFG